ncbi:MAG: ribonuclease R, partial [Gammaproteobacteria bacterium]|nr:ribonuclease R [Gammaproteobacteria bacterium]
GDHAIVRVSGRNRRGKREGKLVEVIARANDTIVGRYFMESEIGFVVPDNKRIHQDIFIPPGKNKKASHGQFVVVKLIRQPDKHTQPVGKITEVITDHYSTHIASDIAIRSYDLPYKWPGEVQTELNEINKATADDSADRRDLTALPFVTIDGEDAKDFDDAVFCEPKGKHWNLYVAIADVSHYVRPSSPLDKEAYKRGTSVYFPDRVVPMLPELLSNNLCSLVPDQNRLVMVCEMKVGKSGEILRYEFYKAEICSKARLTYSIMHDAVFNQNQKTRNKYHELLAHLDALGELYAVMHGYRKQQGLLEFDTTESIINFDEQGEIVSIDPLVRNEAHRLIEEFMLAANISAAKYLFESELPSLYRVHDSPKPEKLEDLNLFLKSFGLGLGNKTEPTTEDYARIIDKVSGRPDGHLIQTVMLRSMPLAYYGESNLGHFGLAFEAYTHFTSPIRRYPDLVVHRAINHLVSKKRPDYLYSEDYMHECGNHCSMTERRAEEASRNVVQRLKCEYMKDKIGEVFNGIVSGVTAFGLFVELENINVEGLIHVTSLPADYYHHDAIHHQLTGEKNRHAYRLGESMRVRLIRVDTDENKIDFELV